MNSPNELTTYLFLVCAFLFIGTAILFALIVIQYRKEVGDNRATAFMWKTLAEKRFDEIRDLKKESEKLRILHDQAHAAMLEAYGANDKLMDKIDQANRDNLSLIAKLNLNA